MSSLETCLSARAAAQRGAGTGGPAEGRRRQRGDGGHPGAHGAGGPFLRRPKRRLAGRPRPEADRQEGEQEDAQPAGHPTPFAARSRSPAAQQCEECGLAGSSPRPSAEPCGTHAAGAAPGPGWLPAWHGGPRLRDPSASAGRAPRRLSQPAVPAPHPGPAHRRPADKGKPGPARPRPLPVPSRCRSPAARCRSAPRPAPLPPTRASALAAPPRFVAVATPGTPDGRRCRGDARPRTAPSTPHSPTLLLSAPRSPS